MTKKQFRWTHSKPLARSNAITNPGGVLVPGPNADKNFIRIGEIFEPTAAELQAFPDRISEVEEKK